MINNVVELLLVILMMCMAIGLGTCIILYIFNKLFELVADLIEAIEEWLNDR